MKKTLLMMFIFCGSLFACGEDTTQEQTKEDLQVLEVSGTWNTVFGGAVDDKGRSAGSAVVLKLTQQKTEIRGTYAVAAGAPPVAPGSVTGRLSGTTLKGTWHDQTGAKGPFSFTFNEKASSFSGFWKSAQLKGEWSGTLKIVSYEM